MATLLALENQRILCGVLQNHFRTLAELITDYSPNWCNKAPLQPIAFKSLATCDRFLHVPRTFSSYSSVGASSRLLYNRPLSLSLGTRCKSAPGGQTASASWIAPVEHAAA